MRREEEEKIHGDYRNAQDIAAYAAQLVLSPTLPAYSTAPVPQATLDWLKLQLARAHLEFMADTALKGAPLQNSIKSRRSSLRKVFFRARKTGYCPTLAC